MNFTPEHLHLMINHIPIVGVPLALLVLAVGLVRKQKLLVTAGVALVLAATLPTPLIMGTGEEAAGRYMANDPGTIDLEAKHWVHEHEERAESAGKLFYVLLLVSLAALICNCKAPKWGQPLAIATLILGLASMGVSYWIAEAGGKIRRPDFRTESPASHVDHDHDHDHGHAH